MKPISNLVNLNRLRTPSGVASSWENSQEPLGAVAFTSAWLPYRYEAPLTEKSGSA